MVLVYLPSDALSQHLPSYLGFSYFGLGVPLQGCSSKTQPLLLTLDEGYLLTAAPADLELGVAPLSPPAPCSSRSLEVGLLLSAAAPALRMFSLLLAAAPDLEGGLAPLATAPVLGLVLAPLCHRP